MTLSLPSSFVVASRGWFATNVIEKASSKESGLFILRGNYPVPCRLKFAQPLYTDKLLSRKNRQTVFAVPDGCDKDERGSTYARNDGQMSSNFQNDESINDLDLELMYPALRSGREISRSIEQHGERTLLEKLKAIHLHVLASEQWNASRLALCHRNYLASATNLIHYLAMKALDVEQLREEAASIGLNLETIYPHVLASLTALIRIFDGAHSESSVAKGNSGIKIWSAEHVEKKGNGNFTIHAMRKKASFERERLLGPFYDANTTHIMVTVGPEAAQSETVIPDLLKRGTTIIRINCAHGDPNVWTEIVRRVKHSSLMLEKPCRVLMDLAGPKLRTDRLKPGPGVMKISPKRNASGNVIIPAQVWLLQRGSKPPVAHVYPDADAVLYIDGQDLLTRLEPGDSLRLLDARGKKRILKINRKLHLFGGTGFIAECARTAYVHTGAEIFLRGKKGKDVVGQIVDVPPSEPFIRLKVGDLLMIYRHSPPLDKSASAKPTHNAHTITCSSSYLFDSVKPGDPIAFDDGKIWGVIQGTSMSEIIVSVTHAAPKGTKLGSDKSINIPRSEIQFKGLTSKDLRDLDFVASQADMVGVSFVRDVQDIIMLKHELDQRKLENLGIVLKIETRRGFENLPLMLLEAMKCPNPLGVMIARGDLAVECGWEKLADLQEEILTTCGAAHVPVIWATQVLESLVKSGVPTRAEITDVACGKRASCIMLNKGKNIMEAVSTLNAILRSCSLKMKADLKPFVLTTNHLF